MNSFEPQYLKLSLKYLEEKLTTLKIKRKNHPAQDSDEKSKIQRMVTNLFK